MKQDTKNEIVLALVLCAVILYEIFLFSLC